MIADIDRGRVRVLVLKIGRRDEVYGVNKAELKDRKSTRLNSSHRP